MSYANLNVITEKNLHRPYSHMKAPTVLVHCMLVERPLLAAQWQMRWLAAISAPPMTTFTNCDLRLLDLFRVCAQSFNEHGPFAPTALEKVLSHSSLLDDQLTIAVGKCLRCDSKRNCGMNTRVTFQSLEQCR